MLNKDYTKKTTDSAHDRILFVIPTYNEEKNISKVLDDITSNVTRADILAVNDCSKDGTLQVLENLATDRLKDKLFYLNLSVNLGYSGALQAGFKYAKMKKYDYVILFDGDGQHLACEAYKLYERIRSCNANIVIGSRFIEQTSYNHPFFRKIGTSLFRILIKLITNTTITDPTSGLQIIDRKTIARYSAAGQYPEFPDANLLVKMIIDGFKIEEVSVQMKENADGVSMHAGVIKPAKYMVKTLYSLMIVSLKAIFKKIF